MPLRRLLASTVLGLSALLVTPAPASAEPFNDVQLALATGWLTAEHRNPGELPALGLPLGLSADEAAASLDELWTAYRATLNDPELGGLPPKLADLVAQADGGGVALTGRTLTLGELTMPLVVIRRETQAPAAAGRPLFICTHGGGQNDRADGPHAWDINTREWQTQVQFAAQLYGPEGIYVVPRMADDRLGRWWHRHNHDAFERVIEQAVAHWGVDPDRVYLLGISEGGYGTDILAPFMPDRFAGANAMAAGVDLGNPAENLRNLAFRTDVGEDDTTFNRVGLAKKFHQRLDELHAADPDGYTHVINAQPGRGHGIDYRPGVDWIARHTRHSWPDTLVWTGKELHDRRRTRHYWIEIDGEVQAHAVHLLALADREHNTIDLTAEQRDIEGDGGNPTHAGQGEVTQTSPLSGVTLRVLLHDRLLDLDKPVRVTCNGELLFEGQVVRDAAVQLRTLAGYGDPAMAASAEVLLRLN